MNRSPCQKQSQAKQNGWSLVSLDAWCPAEMTREAIWQNPSWHPGKAYGRCCNVNKWTYHPLVPDLRMEQIARFSEVYS